MSRLVIVNADDFGLSLGVNAGVVAAHENGVVTAASLMVHQPAAQAAAAHIRAMPALDAGLHVDLGEWEFADGQWQTVYQRVDLADGPAVEREVRLQVSRFEAMTGRLPTHVDSHQHVHQREEIWPLFERVAADLHAPLRHQDPVFYCGDFYAQTAEGESLPGRVTRESLLAIIDRLPPGVSELACHPAAEVDMPGSYGAERLEELRTLSDRRLFGDLRERGVVLARFGEVVL